MPGWRGGCLLYLLVVKNAVLVPLRLFSLERSTARDFAVVAGDKVLCKNWYLLGQKIISSHTHKSGSWYLLGVVFKFSNKHPCPGHGGLTNG